MPKINVYLPDDLAEAVKEAGIPTSAIAQAALDQAARWVASFRRIGETPIDLDNPAASMSRLTDRARTALRLATTAARDAGQPTVGTRHLLAGVLAEGDNLAIGVLDAMEIDRPALARALTADPTRSGQPGTGTTPGPELRWAPTAAQALRLTAVEALTLGHNYIGCEHLLLGIIAEPDGSGGRALREQSAAHLAARRAVVTALQGYAYARARRPDGPTAGSDPTAVLRAALAPLVARIERLERQLATPTG